MANLKRFIEAQEYSYNTALAEVKKGEKKTHWMWYIFPQIKGLGFSEISIYYAIEDLEEAKEYLENEILRKRLFEISNALLELETNNPIEVFGPIDSMKLKSSMTLFSLASDDQVFMNVLEKFYDSEQDDKTIELSKVKRKKFID